jgi:hypothetical protein
MSDPDFISAVGRSHPLAKRFGSPVLLNVYDLAIDGKPLKSLNAMALKLGFGAFHSGVEVFGKEISYSYDRMIIISFVRLFVFVTGSFHCLFVYSFHFLSLVVVCPKFSPFSPSSWHLPQSTARLWVIYLSRVDSLRPHLKD